MKQKYLVVAVALAAAACARTAPIYKVQDQQVITANQKATSDQTTIHTNYNGWVQNLDRAIRTELSRL